MDVINQEDTVPFTTADGSTIRELLAHRNSSIRQQSLAEARLAPGASHHAASPRCDGRNLLHLGW